MNTLLHICCAPCANQCIEVLRTDGFQVTGYWYNPNIHPFTEYRARRNCLRDYAATIDLPLIEQDEYALRPFIREVAEDIGNRCVKCYEIRLFEAARTAKEKGFDSFTSVATRLWISRSTLSTKSPKRSSISMTSRATTRLRVWL